MQQVSNKVSCTGVRQGKLYRLLGHHIRRSKGTLDRELMSVTKSEQEALKIELIPGT